MVKPPLRLRAIAVFGIAAALLPSACAREPSPRVGDRVSGRTSYRPTDPRRLPSTAARGG